MDASETTKNQPSDVSENSANAPLRPSASNLLQKSDNSMSGGELDQFSAGSKSQKNWREDWEMHYLELSGSRLQIQNEI